jgi:hypothetical protein
MTGLLVLAVATWARLPAQVAADIAATRAEPDQVRAVPAGSPVVRPLERRER